MSGKHLKKHSKYLILLPVILAALVLAINLNKPFVGHHDFMSSMEGIIAKNYLKFGIWDLKFGQVLGNVDQISQTSFFTHYPPLLPLLIAGSFSIFGVFEWTERLIPAAFSVMGVFFFFLICRKLWNQKIALLAAAFFIFNPMFIYFGKLPAPEPLILSLAVVAFYFYLNWLESRSNKDLFKMCLSLFLGGLVGWPIDYFAPLIILHSLIIGKFNFKIFIPGLVLLGTLFLQFFHNYLITGVVLSEEIINTAKFRLTENNLSFGGQQFSLLTYIKQEVSWLQVYYTRVMIILSAIFMMFNLNLKFNIQKATVLFFLLFGLAHPVIFSRYVFIHDFLNIYLLPFFALSAALGLMTVIETLNKVKINKLVIVALVVFILGLFIFERLPYTKALLKTEMNQPGKEMAMTLNALQKNPYEAAVISPRFDSFYGIFSNYYSEKPYAILSEEEFKKSGPGNLKFIVTIDQDIKDQLLFQNLKDKYQSWRKDDLTVILLNEPK
jgi:hypothetical protein